MSVSVLFWKIHFPFHARYYEERNKIRYIHIVCVVVALILPATAPVTLAVKGGFTLASFPPVICVGRDFGAIYYSSSFPTTLSWALCTTLLLFIFWRIRRVYGVQTHDWSNNIV